MAKKKQDEPPKGSPAWMATFSDLMNLLLCFFVLLYASASTDVEKLARIEASFSNRDQFSILSQGSSSVSAEGELISNGSSQLTELDIAFNSLAKADGDEITSNTNLSEKYEQEGLEQSEEMASEVKEKIEANNLQNEIDVQYNAQYVQLSLNGALLFDSGKAEIKESSKAVLNKIGSILKKYSSNIIEIEGHTDNVPISSIKYASNLELSTARACTVYTYLLGNFNLDPTLLKASGYGENVPIASNSTPEGRAKNRRVEIKIYNRLNSQQ